jgi:Cdc6-like AAA superfamily ATPase
MEFSESVNCLKCFVANETFETNETFGDCMKPKNPFSPSFPVDPEYFVNRTKIIDSFKIAVDRSLKTTHPTPDNMAILGEWGVGKSSVLKKFEWLCAKEFKDRKIFSALVELVPVACTDFDNLAKKIIDDIDRNIIAKSTIPLKARNKIKEWRIKSVNAFGIGAERKNKVENPATVLKNSLLDLWEIIEKEGGDTMMIMLDDLHYLSENYSEGLYDLRGIFQNLPKHGCNFIVVVSGKKELFADIRELAEPLSRFFNIKHTLDVFGSKETKDAILKPIDKTGLDLKINHDVIERIHELTRGHPFFIHFIMRELVSMKGSGRITMKYFNEAYKELQKMIEKEKFEIDFLIASPKEKEILSEAAKLNEVFSPSEIKLEYIRKQLGLLVEKNLLKKHERGEYSLYHPLFKEYLKKQL